MNPHRARKPVDEFDDSPIKYPSQLPSESDGKNPHVIIAGAGLGGLFLAILLDKAGIPYEIFERSEDARPLGSIMSLNASILAAIEQVGLLEELRAISFEGDTANILYENMKLAASFPDPNKDGSIGYSFASFARPKLHQLLLSKVPSERIHYSKKVLSSIQNKDGVMIRCADGTTYHGDILVGADGAYSAVRQNLFKTLEKKGLLPPDDAKELSQGYFLMVGTTNSLDPEQFPLLKEKGAVFNQVIGNSSSYTWGEFNIPENKICWAVVGQIASVEEATKIKFRNSEWGPEAHPDFIPQVRDFPLPTSGTMGKLIDATPPADICRVFLEDKLFETWNHGRTVLIGDAAHKMLPSGGQGAVCAMQDAVVLANCLYDMRSPSHENIEAALQEFKAQRFFRVKEQVDKSNINAIILHGQTFFERVARYMVLNWVPESIKTKELHKGVAYRPQANFLPLVPNRGTADVIPQKPSKRYEEEQRQKREEALKQQASSASQSAVTPAAEVV